jgi:hypothetical protein
MKKPARPKLKNTSVKRYGSIPGSLARFIRWPRSVWIRDIACPRADSSNVIFSPRKTPESLLAVRIERALGNKSAEASYALRLRNKFPSPEAGSHAASTPKKK